MQNFKKLQSALNPIFMRHNAEKVFITGIGNDHVLNLYVVGCPRAKLPQIQEEIYSALYQPTGITMAYIEAEMMIDSQIRMSGELLYEKRCA